MVNAHLDGSSVLTQDASGVSCVGANYVLVGDKNDTGGAAGVEGDVVGLWSAEE